MAAGFLSSSFQMSPSMLLTPSSTELQHHCIKSSGCTATIARVDSSSAACSASHPGYLLSPSASSRATLLSRENPKQLHMNPVAELSMGKMGRFVRQRGRGLEGLDGWKFGRMRECCSLRGSVPEALRCSVGGSAPRLPGGIPPDRRSPERNYISPPGLGQFRPPPTAYVPEYKESEEEKNNAAVRTAHLVEKVRDGQGSWQERAAFIKELQQLGVTSEDLYTLTFVPIYKQLEVVVAGQVFESLVQSDSPSDVLEWFDETSTSLLYALRTLSFGQRRSAAEYVKANSLSVEEAQKLAWAIKDHERRPVGRKGFTPAPGDCLAFMYHRQALENQDLEQKSNLVKMGLSVAATESAKERFSEFALQQDTT